VGAVGFERGDRFLLCTDGVTDGLYDSRVEDFLSQRPPEPAKELVAEAVRESGRDNATALVIEVG
jgi:protein phosphatase